ncbi:MAG: HD-GYP domain-containing protein [Terriglobales bacterium]
MATVLTGPEPLRVKQLEEQLHSLHTALICGFNQLLDLKDLGTGMHSTRLAEWAVRVAGHMGGEEVARGEEWLRDLEVAALLHDIGKIGVPDYILNKQGPLTPEERALINKHPEYGWAILRNFPGLERASLFVLHHHENFDGGGYPAGLAGSEIPLGSRIVSIVDAFDAMVSNRPYRAGLPIKEALRRLSEAAGTQFDPAVLACFLEIVQAEATAVAAATAPRTALVKGAA